MHGGVGRFTYNLVKSLRSNNIDVKVVSDSHGSGDYHGLSPQKTKLLLNIIKEYNRDLGTYST